MKASSLTTRGCVALVVEDDPVTLEFLAEALVCVGWKVLQSSHVAAALKYAEKFSPDLILCDVRLPDGSAFAVSTALNLAARPAPPRPYAIALSAEMDPALQDRLRNAGFHRVLRKPVALSELLDAVSGLAPAQSLPAPGTIDATLDSRRTVLDDEAALSVCGAMQTVEALRAMFATELPDFLSAISRADASRDHPTLQETLHRLRSACGFCGATALGAAVAAAAAEVGSPVQSVERLLQEGRALADELADRSRRLT